MKKFVFLLTIFLISTLLLTSCDLIEKFRPTQSIEGSGEVVIEKRDLPGYNRIEASGDFELYVTQLSHGVEVHADNNLMKYIRTYVQEHTLVIETTDAAGRDINLRTLEPIRVYVRLTRIEGISLARGVDLTSSQLVAENARIDLSLSGGSTAHINAIRTGTLNINLAGESDLRVVDGRVTEQFITASDGSVYEAEWLRSELTEIKLAGGSEATIWAKDTFQVDLTDGSIAYYYGSPVNLTEIQNRDGSDYISRGDR